MGSVESQKTFLLGMGAQKAGTSWLHWYLHQHPQCDFGPIKEYNVFDGIYMPECRGSDRRRYNVVAKMAGVIKAKVWRALGKKALFDKLLSFQEDEENYYTFFQSILSAKGNVCVTGDISPEYSGLPRIALENIQSGFSRKGIKVKVVFLMRDPIERCWSAVRMYKRHKTDQIDQACDEVDALRKYFGSEQANFRTRYDKTMKEIEAVFDEKDIKYVFYEELFTTKTIQEVCDFLAIEFEIPELEKRINVSVKTMKLPESLARDIANFYEIVYRQLSLKFGVEKMQRLWKGYKYI